MDSRFFLVMMLGVASMDATTAPYAHPLIFLFMGGFLLGLAIEKWNLHKRIALSIIKLTGTNGNRIILGFILATGFISMWISNTATAAMMVPLAIGLASSQPQPSPVRGWPMAPCLRRSLLPRSR